MDARRPLNPYSKAAAAVAVLLLPASAGAQLPSVLTAALERELTAIGKASSSLTADGTSTGPDVTAVHLTDVMNYTSGGSVGGYRAYALGASTCNAGTEPLEWDGDTHPVFAQNLYRLAGGSFQQIGMSWLKHGFAAFPEADPACGDCQPCADRGTGKCGNLPPGCVDVYTAELNGHRPLGMRSEVDPTTGEFPYPWTFVCIDGRTLEFCETQLEERIRVLETDLDPALNAGGLYWMEGQYVAPDDAVEGNGLNNASYRRAIVGPMPTLDIALTGEEPTMRELSAVHAWQAEDAGVELVVADVPNSVPVQRFEAARRIRPIAGGLYHAEVTLRNLNSARAGRALEVQFSRGGAIRNVGFHDVDRHSGEFDPDSGLPYLTTDWTVTVDGDSVRWETDPFDTTPNANALRWATMYTFWFDSDRPPGEATYRLELFVPGEPTTLEIPFVGAIVFADGFEAGDTGAWDQTVN